MSLVAYIDGGSRGNPGPAGFGVRIEASDGSLVEEFHGSIGVATNNIAEYRGLLAALEWALARGERHLSVRSDSQLLVQQMRGAYKVRHPGLQPLYARAQQLVRQIGRVTFEHVGRELNAHADRLANAAMDSQDSHQSAVASHQSSDASEPKAPNPRPRAAKPQSLFSLPPGTEAQTDSAVRLFIYRHFAETGRAPDASTIGRALSASDADVEATLRRLADLHAIVLAPASTNIWMAHPFSAVPTAYPVVANGRSYFANCAWDAAGILSLLGVDGECRTRCADCGEDLAFHVRDGSIGGDGVVHFAIAPRRFWENIAFT